MPCLLHAKIFSFHVIKNRQAGTCLFTMFPLAIWKKRPESTRTCALTYTEGEYSMNFFMWFACSTSAMRSGKTNLEMCLGCI